MMGVLGPQSMSDISGVVRMIRAHGLVSPNDFRRFTVDIVRVMMMTETTELFFGLFILCFGFADELSSLGWSDVVICEFSRLSMEFFILVFKFLIS